MLTEKELSIEVITKRNKGRGTGRRVQLFCRDESRTKQDQADDCDINFIMKKYSNTQLVTHLNQYQPQYGEFAKFDFQENMNTVARAIESFESLPSNIRTRFNNDPAQFFDFVNKIDDKGNPSNLDEMIKLGLAVKHNPRPVPEPVTVKLSKDDLDVISKNIGKNA